jgi:hypothetical protein
MDLIDLAEDWAVVNAVMYVLLHKRPGISGLTSRETLFRGTRKQVLLKMYTDTRISRQTYRGWTRIHKVIIGYESNRTAEEKVTQSRIIV